MTAWTTVTRALPGAPVLRPLAEAFGAWRRARRARAKAHAQYRELLDYDDHQLEDIGLTRETLRCELETMAYRSQFDWRALR